MRLNWSGISMSAAVANAASGLMPGGILAMTWL